MKQFIDKVEKYLIRFIVLGVILLVVGQGLMTQDSMRLFLSWGERMEGQTVEFPVNSGESALDEDMAATVESPHALVVLGIQKYSSLPKAHVLVNGEQRESFLEKELTLQLMAGDVIEIDSSYYNFPVEVKVEKVSENLAFPRKDEIYTGNHDIVMIGKIVVK